ncbi:MULTISPECIES: GNAT family N-acetyltransferase [Alicyclobacillus]|uniref:GNAT family N-acetyltransferase n=1 Tax=Alicyclobacillus acidoterrestris (strain ATCC 49025 / DSM 3922 / CIP 106132 / NCIMB 13137 / GD3B) TaxID=1356854 RepID=A0A9E6ZH57_ALIAG|nr:MULTISPECIES: GNAT family N-acetyltransferase [Alicyclobacillus]UNO50520.1 GNAT family N-acetyltransferase [Alicyclobacillus acidoterrestris]
MNLLIRPVRASDAQSIYRIMMQEQVMPYIISLPSDRLEQLEDRYRTLPKNVYEFVAEVDGDVVGNAGLVQLSARRSHVGTFYIAVDSNFHGKGIGTALITKILDLADNWLMLERVELGVLATNPRAQALYERHGFVVEGKKRGAIRSAGEYVDEVVMSRLRPNGLLNRQV